MSQLIIPSTELNELSKANLSIRVAEAEKNLVDGADEYLQLMSVCSLAMTCLEESKTSKK
jgi:replication factor C subunit 2/4